MHEVSLMGHIISTVLDNAADNNIQRVTKVKLVAGKLTNAGPDILQFAFQAVRGNEPLISPDAVLEIDEILTKAVCQGCRHEFAMENTFPFFCPQCCSTHVDIVAGREFYVDYFEGE